jgi:hypothetical protein
VWSFGFGVPLIQTHAYIYRHTQTHAQTNTDILESKNLKKSMNNSFKINLNIKYVATIYKLDTDTHKHIQTHTVTHRHMQAHRYIQTQTDTHRRTQTHTYLHIQTNTNENK